MCGMGSMRPALRTYRRSAREIWAICGGYGKVAAEPDKSLSRGWPSRARNPRNPLVPGVAPTDAARGLLRCADGSEAESSMACS
jgi:hypothetical protein